MENDVKADVTQNEQRGSENHLKEIPNVEFDIENQNTQLKIKDDEVQNEQDELKKNQSEKSQEYIPNVDNFQQQQNEALPTFAEDEINKSRRHFFDLKNQFFRVDDAYLHQSANMVYKSNNKTQQLTEKDTPQKNNKVIQDQMKGELEKMCPCCQLYDQGNDNLIDIFKSSDEDISHLGPAYPLYFQFMKYSMGLLAIITLVSGIYNLVQSNSRNRCENLDGSLENCNVTFTTEYAQSNRELNSPDEIFSILNLITCIILIIFTLGYNYQQLQTIKQLDKNIQSVSDYSIFMNQIPKDKKSKDIEKFIYEQVKGVKIVKIVQSFKLKDYNELYRKLQQKDRTQKEKDKIIKEIEQCEKKCREDEKNFSGACYVSFEYEEQANAVINHFKIPYINKLFGNNKDTSKTFDGHQITVIKAQEPGDTNWENIELSTKTKIKRRLLTLFLSLCCILGSFTAVFFISKTQEDIKKTESNYKKVQGYSFLGSVTIVILNQIIQLLIQLLSNYEAHNFKTDTIISIARKSGVTQLLNTVIVQFAVDMIQNGFDIWKSGGLIDDVTSLLISNTIFPALISFVSPENIYQWIRQQWFLLKPIEEQKKYTQMEVHELFELPTFNPAACFASAANTLLLASFYSWIIPLGVPFSILSLLLQMMVNKYKLLRRQRISTAYGAELPEKMKDFYFKFVTFFFSLGKNLHPQYNIIQNEFNSQNDPWRIFKNIQVLYNLIFLNSKEGFQIIYPLTLKIYYKLNKYPQLILYKLGCLTFELITFSKVHSCTLASVVISGFFYFFPTSKILHIIVNDNDVDTRPYKQENFTTDYERKNPVLQNEAMKQYIDQMIEKEQDRKTKQQLRQKFYPNLDLFKTYSKIHASPRGKKNSLINLIKNKKNSIQSEKNIPINKINNVKNTDQTNEHILNKKPKKNQVASKTQ